MARKKNIDRLPFNDLYELADAHNAPIALARIIDQEYWLWNTGTARYTSARAIQSQYRSARYCGIPIHSIIASIVSEERYRSRHYLQCQYCPGMFWSTRSDHIYCDECLPYRRRGIIFPNNEINASDKFLYGR